MFLLETFPGHEVSANGLPVGRAIPAPVLARARGELVACAGCRMSIHAAMRLLRGRPHHPSCAARASAPKATIAPAAPKAIGSICGVALTFDRPGDRGGCSVVDRNGTPEHEAFSPTCFDDSIAAGDIALRVNHGDSSLRGSFSRLANDAGSLVFRFKLLDGAFERTVFERVRAGTIRHCSIGFIPGARQWRHPMSLHTRATLTEISLCADGNRPQWHSTIVRAEVL